MSRDGITRRNALTGAATVGVAMPLLAACGGDDSTATDPSTGTGGGSSSGSSGGSGGASGAELASASDIPVGGGKIFTDESVVVTQPTDGDFKCFTAVCTHQGCLVSNVEGGTINCTCHGSMFSIEDGSVEGGPAPSALEAVEISVEGGSISLA